MVIRSVREQERGEAERIDNFIFSVNQFADVFQIVLNNIVSANKLAAGNKFGERVFISRVQCLAVWLHRTQIDYFIVLVNFAVHKNDRFHRNHSLNFHIITIIAQFFGKCNHSFVGKNNRKAKNDI